MCPGSADILSAFWALSSDRKVGFGFGPIPFTAIDRWADRHGITDPDDFRLFHAGIRAADAEYVEIVNRKKE